MTVFKRPLYVITEQKIALCLIICNVFVSCFVCLKGEVEDQRIILKCRLTDFNSKVSFIDPHGKTFGFCLPYKSGPQCSTNITQDHETHIATLSIDDTFLEKYVGNWTCSYDNHNTVDSYNIKLIKPKFRTISGAATDEKSPVFIGEYSKLNKQFSFTVDCKWCDTNNEMIGKTIYFLVDGKTVDFIRVYGDKCFNKKGECHHNECSCSPQSDIFRWKYASEFLNEKHTFEMEFKIKNIIDGRIFIAKSYISFNDYEFGKQETSFKAIEDSIEEDIRLLDCKYKKGLLMILYVSLLTFSSTFCIYICCLIIFKRTRTKLKVRIINTSKALVEKAFCIESRRKKGLLLSGLDEKRKNEETCHLCKDFWTSAVCVDCKNVYCEVCCVAHTKHYPNHTVCQIQNVFTCKFKVKCKSCNKKAASIFCTKCKEILCENCSNENMHKNHNKKKLNTEHTRCRKRTSSESDVDYIKKISIENKNKNERITPVRICGISFIADGRLVVLDNNHYTIMVYSGGLFMFEKILFDEPRGITQMENNNVAITFGYKMEIRIYEVTYSDVIPNHVINMLNFNLGNIKPFSISYDKHHFAVEAGEGDDGRIVILEQDGSLKNVLINRNDCMFFTGNTIRLALNMSNGGKVYISNLSKKAVVCIDFNSTILWNVLIPSPRSVVFVREDLSGDFIICASRRCNVIYRLNDHDGNDEIILSKKDVRSPRYIAYNSKKRLLCIQVARDPLKHSSGEDLLIYRYDPRTLDEIVPIE